MIPSGPGDDRTRVVIPLSARVQDPTLLGEIQFAAQLPPVGPLQVARTIFGGHWDITHFRDLPFLDQRLDVRIAAAQLLIPDLGFDRIFVALLIPDLFPIRTFAQAGILVAVEREERDRLEWRLDKGQDFLELPFQ